MSPASPNYNEVKDMIVTLEETKLISVWTIQMKMT